MKEEEYADLNELNKVFKKKPLNENKSKKNKAKIKITNKKSILKKILSFTKKIAVKFLNISNKYLKKTFEISRLKIEKTKKQINEYTEARRGKIAYKIVETKKKKRNKIIITRKRVPIEKNINFENRDLNPSIYYCRLVPEENKICEKKIIGHTRLKDSIWDFPHKK